MLTQPLSTPNLFLSPVDFVSLTTIEPTLMECWGFCSLVPGLLQQPLNWLFLPICPSQTMYLLHRGNICFLYVTLLCKIFSLPLSTFKGSSNYLPWPCTPCFPSFGLLNSMRYFTSSLGPGLSMVTPPPAPLHVPEPEERVCMRSEKKKKKTEESKPLVSRKEMNIPAPSTS